MLMPKYIDFPDAASGSVEQVKDVKREERSLGVQALRGIAAFIVVLFHFSGSTYSDAALNTTVLGRLAGLGAAGVDLFFCISGYVMLSAATRGNLTEVKPLKFLTLRLIRIMPMYWLATTLLVGLYLLNYAGRIGLTGTLATPRMAISYLVSSYALLPVANPLMPGRFEPFLGPGWTLSFEMYFYAVLALVARRGAPPAVILFRTVAAFLVIGLGAYFASPDSAMGQFFANPVLAEFAFGAMVFLLLRRSRRFGAMAVLAGGTLLLVGAVAPIDDTLRFLYWGVPAALVLYGVIALDGRVRIPTILLWVGDASFSLYLLHTIVTYLFGGLLKRGLFQGGAAPTIAMVGTIIATVLCAIAFYRLVEVPVTKRLNKRALAHLGPA